MFLMSFILGVRVSTVAVGAFLLDGEYACSGFEQSPAEERGLAEVVATVVVLRGGFFLSDVDRVADWG